MICFSNQMEFMPQTFQLNPKSICNLKSYQSVLHTVIS